MTPSQEQATVLVVDDEETVAQAYAERLRERYAVRIAYNGKEALESLDEDVDVVLLDRKMPRLSGDEVLAQIREDNLNCRVAMVTGVEPDFDILDMGFDDYLLKPVSTRELESTVETLLMRTTYDAQIQEFFSLQSKRVMLESKKDERELKDRDDYTELIARIAELREQLDRTLEELDDDIIFDARAFGSQDEQ